MSWRVGRSRPCPVDRTPLASPARGVMRPEGGAPLSTPEFPVEHPTDRSAARRVPKVGWVGQLDRGAVTGRTPRVDSTSAMWLWIVINGEPANSKPTALKLL